MHMRPQADASVGQLSVDRTLSQKRQFALGEPQLFSDLMVTGGLGTRSLDVLNGRHRSKH